MSPRSLAAAYAALLALTALTVVAAFRDLGGLNLPLALAIAGLKAALVALSFMRLGGESPTVRLWAAAGVVWLLLLIGLAMADFGTRGPRWNDDRGNPVRGFRAAPRWPGPRRPATTQHRH